MNQGVSLGHELIAGALFKKKAAGNNLDRGSVCLSLGSTQAVVKILHIEGCNNLTTRNILTCTATIRYETHDED